jgi:anaerobic selenocysteine-containing dehydrogenase
MIKLSRREFLKSTAAVTAAAGLCVPTAPALKAFTSSSAPVSAPVTRTTYSIATCGGCHQMCALKVTIQDERVTKVEPADFFQDVPRMRHACLKAYATVRLTYNPDRIKYPMKRVGDRGSGKWERISWDEAYNTIATTLNDIRTKYGPHTVMAKFGGSSTVGNVGGRLMGTRFASVIGAGGDSPPGYTTDGGVPAALLYTFGDSQIGTNSLYFKESKLLVQWGGNPAESTIRDFKHIVEAKASGTRYVVVGVVFDATAAKADQFIGVRLATDAALALSMINTVITENLYDKAFVTNYTVGPFLIRNDNKKYLRESDVVSGGSDKNYVVWDTASQSAQAVAPKAQPAAGVTPAITGSYTVNGIAVKPAFQLLAERAAEYPADKAQQITNVPAQTILDFAREYATSKPACINIMSGMVRTRNGNIGARAVATLAAICGNVGVRGGGPGGTQVTSGVKLNTGPVQTAQGAPGTERVTGARCEVDVWTSVRDGKYPIHAFIGGYRNFMQAYGNAANYKAIFAKFDFIVQIGLFMDLTTSYADIVLPDATTFERADIYSDASGMNVYMTRPIQPLYESKPNPEIFTELAKRMGYGDQFNKTTEEWLKTMIASNDPTLQGVTWEKLQQNGYVRGNLNYTTAVSYADKKFPTPSGRVEFYQEVLIPMGEELPIHKENLESPRSSPLATKYPLSYMTKRSRYFMQTSYSNVDWLRKLVPEPMLEINPADATPRGLKDGDVVRVFNDRGEAVCKCKFTQAMPPGLVNIDHGWWPADFIRGHYNYLTWPIDDPQTINPTLITDLIRNDPGRAAANHTLIYDVLVQVEKFTGTAGTGGQL